jgi:NDP-sugar pyrophosphorylase family protein
VRAVVLVGGEGTRLRPLTTTVPKPLLPIVGQAFLERQLSWLRSHGVDDVVLSLGYLPDAFQTHFPDAQCDGVRLHYATEPYPLGTAGAIRFAAASAGIDERFVVCNGDVLTTLDLSALLAFHVERAAEATIHLTRVDDPSAFGVVPTHDDGEVKAFVEKPPPGAAPTDWINAGTYVLEPSVLDDVPPDLTVSIERETFPRMLEEGRRLFAHGTDDYWLDIGTPDKYLQAHLDVLAGRVGFPPAPGAREIDSGTWVVGTPENAPKIAADAVLTPPVFLDADAVVGSGAHLSGASVGVGAVIEAGAHVENAVVADGARIGPDARVIDSIIGPGAVVEDSAVVLDHSIVGARARVDAGLALAGSRVEFSAGAG